MDLAPLSARSVALSLLLGSHPDQLTPSQLIRAGEHFGIPATTLRVALTRAVASGDVRRAHRGSSQRQATTYGLGQRLLERQRRQDEALRETTDTGWDGSWELAVIVVSGRPGPARAALRERLTAARLAELREGVWTRPANLRSDPAALDDRVITSFLAFPDTDPAQLAGDLWDLTTWAETGRTLLRHLDRGGASAPAQRLTIAARLVRHLTADPLLPAALLPRDWPGAELRTAYAAYQDELRALALA